MNKAYLRLLLFTIMITLCYCQKLFSQEVGQIIKTERFYKLYDLKERLDFQSFSPKQLEQYISTEFKYNLQKETYYDKSGRIIQEKDFRRAGEELIVEEKISNYSYNKDTITRKDYNEDGTLRIISKYREIKDGHQVFQHSVFRVPEIMTPGITSNPLRRETIYHYNLSTEEQKNIVNNLYKTFPVELIFKNVTEEDGVLTVTSTSSKGAWPPEQLMHQISDSKTGNSVVYHCKNTFEEIDIESFPQNSDTLNHRIYKKIKVNFGHDKEKSQSFRPNQFIPGDTLKHEEWFTIALNDSIRITSHIIFKGYDYIRKYEEHFKDNLLIKKTDSKLEGGVWNTIFTKKYVRFKNFCLVEIKNKHETKLFKNYYVSVYEYY